MRPIPAVQAAIPISLERSVRSDFGNVEKGVECGPAALAFSKDDVSRAAVLSPDEPLADQAQACVFESVAFIIKATARQLLKAKPRVESHGLPIVSVNLKLEFTLQVQGM